MSKVKMVAFRGHLSPVGMIKRGQNFELDETAAKRYDERLAHLAGRVEEEPGGGAALPEDFPGRDSLLAAGFATTAELEGKTREELVEIEGIGPATADKILDALK